MKRIFLAVNGVVLSCLMLAGLAEAKKVPQVVEIWVDISNQSMAVDVDGWPYARWKVSTAREGYYTPRGSWRPFLLKKIHYLRKYDNSPMPNSIFFHGGYAIHATGYVKSLGRPASHGCVRLDPQNALRLHGLVQKYGLRATRISISN